MSAWPEWLQVEVDAHRTRHTWGGYVWFPEEPVNVRWQAGEDDLDEIEWLLDGCVHPLLIAQTMRRGAAAIYRTAKRHDRVRVSDAFVAYSRLRTTNERKAS